MGSVAWGPSSLLLFMAKVTVWGFVVLGVPVLEEEESSEDGVSIWGILPGEGGTVEEVVVVVVDVVVVDEDEGLRPRNAFPQRMRILPK